MPRKNIRSEWLVRLVQDLHDDLNRPWEDYPCIEWPFSRNVKGYGKLLFDGHTALAHRTSLILTVGEIGQQIACHRCDNPPCIRPSHLFASTPGGNSLDMMLKGRSKQGRTFSPCNVGINHFKARLTDELVYKARLDLLLGVSRKDIAKGLGLSIGGTTAMLRGDNWKHVPFPSKD